MLHLPCDDQTYSLSTVLTSTPLPMAAENTTMDTYHHPPDPVQEYAGSDCAVRLRATPSAYIELEAMVTVSSYDEA